MPPDFLAVGHVTRDVAPGGYTAGGAATYSSVTALRLGLAPAVVTSASPDFDPASQLPGIDVHVVPASHTTTFENVYAGGRRRQRVVSTANPIGADDVPAGWRDAPLALLGPLVGEVDDGMAALFPGSIVMASMQGWLRRWGDDGVVSPAPWDGAETLPHVGAAICSTEDFEDDSLVETWRRAAPVLIVTMGAEGAMLYRGGEAHFVAPFQAREVDPTGAGDVFAAAYLVRYGETADELESARFASCAASFCVQARGADGIPTRPAVEARLREGGA